MCNKYENLSEDPVWPAVENDIGFLLAKLSTHPEYAEMKKNMHKAECAYYDNLNRSIMKAYLLGYKKGFLEGGQK